MGPIVNNTSLSTIESTTVTTKQANGNLVGPKGDGLNCAQIVNNTSLSTTELATSTAVQPSDNSGEHIGDVYMVHL